MTPRCTRSRAARIYFCQNDPGDAVYIVRSGQFAILLATDNGRELVINKIGAGECFGELALLTDAPRCAAARGKLDPRYVFLTWLYKKFSIRCVMCLCGAGVERFAGGVSCGSGGFVGGKQFFESRRDAESGRADARDV